MKSSSHLNYTICDISGMLREPLLVICSQYYGYTTRICTSLVLATLYLCSARYAYMCTYSMLSTHRMQTHIKQLQWFQKIISHIPSIMLLYI